ncbi:MAG: glycosyltransferase [Deltaproteobacteria bacterium]|nr:glycosyltransferase [Deltaproteobacteria bacterium]
MRILLFGSSYFKPWLERAGVDVVQAGLDQDSDLKVDPEQVDLIDLTARIDPRPDVLLLTDNLGRRVVPWGLERSDLIKVYYGVDGPLNHYWQRHLAGLFDLVAVDQKDSAAALSTLLDREVLWLPVAVDPRLYQGPPEEVLFDLAFVGTIQPQVRPKRSSILKALSSRHAVKVAGERGQGWLGPQEAARVYRQSKLVLNENLFPGVTTRMLEVMAAGGCLFTEDNDNGLRDLFRPGEHFIPFGPTNLLDQAERYLKDQIACQGIALAGHRECLAKHSIDCRAQQLLAAIEAVDPAQAGVRPSLSSLAWTFLLLGVRWPKHDGPGRLAKAGVLFNEALGQNPNSGESHLGLGLVLVAQGRLKEAEAALALAAEANDHDYRAFLARGLLLDQMGRVQESRQVLIRAASLADPNQETAPELPQGRLKPGQAGFHLAWGRLLIQAGQGLVPGFNRSWLAMPFWGGLEHLTKALDLEPDNLEALVALAQVLDQHGQFDFSRPLWQKASRLAPAEARIRQGLDQARLLSYGAD